MAIIKCKMCGGDLALEEGSNVAECEYCGSRQTVPSADNEKKLNLFARANRLRANNEFDKAAGVYESIVADFPEEAEAYWGLILCKYGIEYVDDPATGKKIPTCHRSSFDSVMDDPNFELVMEYADPIARRVYRDEAKQLEELRKSIIEVSSKEEPYDIFICYKETAEDGQRTLDSVLAQDVYDMLTENGYRVFFSRVTLEDKLGVKYEPYIFAALNSAKIMLAFGTDYDYYNAVWVKNEWSRFLQLIAKGEKKTLIPCYKNIDAYDIPKEFAKLQAQDLGKVGANQDLLRGIKKILPKESSQLVILPDAKSEGQNSAALLKRGNMALEDGQWDKAKDYYEKVLMADPENYYAYLGIVMADAQTSDKDTFIDVYIKHGIPETAELKRARQFANQDQKAIWGELDKRLQSEDNKRALEEREQEEKSQKEKEKLASIRHQVLRGREIISAAEGRTACTRVDGTVCLAGKDNWLNRKTVTDMQGIIAISIGEMHSVGLKEDGTVIAVGNNYYGECNVSDWKNIVSLSVCSNRTIGLKADGTVVATGNDYNGECDVSKWKDIIEISAGPFHTVGLKNDGTVVAVGSNKDGRSNVMSWRDIVSVSAGCYHTVGLKSDGTVVTTEYTGEKEWDNGQFDISDWNEIISVSANAYHTVGLKADGTVIATKCTKNNKIYSRGQCEVNGWKDIVAITTSITHTVGLRKDGTVLAAGANNNGECDISDWRLFHDFDSIDQERADAYKELVLAEQRRQNEIARKQDALSKQICAAQESIQANQSELTSLKGLFSGKRRKELETEIAELNAQINRMQKQLAAIKD